MRRTVLTITIAFLCSVTSSAHAAVLFNEIAWMGTADNWRCGWIELYNSGEQAVDVEDWVLSIYGWDEDIPTYADAADVSGYAIADGEGRSTSIPAGGYWVLERQTASCEDPPALPDIDDWYVAFGNLPNSGATLRLTRSDGSIVDQVSGGADWSELGGDNSTKDTAQRTDAGWITATPTPGMANMSVDTSSDNGDAESSTTTSGSAAATDTQRLILRGTEPVDTSTETEDRFTLAIAGAEVGYVNQPVVFSTRVGGVESVIEHSLVHTWNFGDLNTGSGAEPEHTYAFPGTYVVAVEAAYAGYEAVARHEITILPVPLSVSVDDDVLRIHNEAPYEVDLSNYELVGNRSLHFPDHSILLPHSTIAVPRSEVAAAEVALVSVRDTTDTIVASNHGAVREHLAVQSAPDQTTSSPAVVARSDRSVQSESDSFRFATAPEVAGAATSQAEEVVVAEEEQKAPEDLVAAPDERTSAVTNSTRSDSASWPERWPYAGLVVLLLGVGYVVLRRQA